MLLDKKPIFSIILSYTEKTRHWIGLIVKSAIIIAYILVSHMNLTLQSPQTLLNSRFVPFNDLDYRYLAMYSGQGQLPVQHQAAMLTHVPYHQQQIIVSQSCPTTQDEFKSSASKQMKA